MRYALIRDGLVENIVEIEAITTVEEIEAALAAGEVPSGYVVPDGVEAVEAPDVAGVGYSYDGEAFTAPAPPAPPPVIMPDISDRQFYQALATPPYAAITGVTMAEAKAAVKVGQLPASIQAVVDAIEDEDERDRSDMLLSGATTFQRSHPEVSRFAAALGWGEDEIDAFWLAAAAL